MTVDGVVFGRTSHCFDLDAMAGGASVQSLRFQLEALSALMAHQGVRVGGTGQGGEGATTTMSMGNFNTISILAQVGNFNISKGMFSAARQNRTRGREEGMVSMEMTNNGNSAEDNVPAAEEARKIGK